MSTVGWLILSTYMLGYAWLLRPTARTLAKDMAFGEIEGEDVIFGLFVGGLVCLFWPIWILPLIAYRHRGTRILGESNADKVERLEREARESRRRIEQLERELEISG